MCPFNALLISLNLLIANKSCQSVAQILRYDRIIRLITEIMHVHPCLASGHSELWHLLRSKSIPQGDIPRGPRLRSGKERREREGLRDGGDEHEENMGKTKTEGGGVSSLSICDYIHFRPAGKRFSK